MNRRAAILGALALALPFAARAEEAGDGAPVGAAVAWVAGLAPSPALEPDDEWLAYSRREDARWRRQAPRLQAMRRWSQRELGARVSETSSVLYPLAGADALHPLALFGRAARIQLLGLEPIGELPSPSRSPAPGYFTRLSDATEDLHRLTFFRTREMSRDMGPLQERPVGVLPTLVSTIARLGGRIARVTPSRPPEAVAIDWVDPEGRGKRLEYARVDLSNEGWGTHAAYLADLRRRATPRVTLLKATSYLVGTPSFSRLRQALLDDSDLLVQDDSGVPYKALGARWSVRLYGSYTRPASPFRDRVETDLAAAYAARATPALPFGIGYSTQPERSNLLVAVKGAS